MRWRNSNPSTWLSESRNPTTVPWARRRPSARASSLWPSRMRRTSRWSLGNAWRSREVRRFSRAASSLGPTGMTKVRSYGDVDAVTVVLRQVLVAPNVEATSVEGLGHRIVVFDIAHDALHNRLIRHGHHVAGLDPRLGQMCHESIPHP